MCYYIIVIINVIKILVTWAVSMLHSKIKNYKSDFLSLCCIVRGQIIMWFKKTPPNSYHFKFLLLHKSTCSSPVLCLWQVFLSFLPWFTPFQQHWPSRCSSNVPCCFSHLKCISHKYPNAKFFHFIQISAPILPQSSFFLYPSKETLCFCSHSPLYFSS